MGNTLFALPEPPENAGKKYVPAMGNGPLKRLAFPSSETGSTKNNNNKGGGEEEFYGVEGLFPIMGGMIKILRNMMVVKNANGELTLINAVRLDPKSEAELIKLGRPTHLVRGSNHHGVDDFYYADKFKCTCWAPTPLAVGGERCSRWGPEHRVSFREYSPEAPPAAAFTCEVRAVQIASNEKSAEVVLFFPAQRAIFSTDLIQNYEGGEPSSDFANHYWPSTAVASALGFKGCMVTAPMFAKSVTPVDEALMEASRRVMALDWDAIFPSHGQPVLSGAKAMREKWLRENGWM